MKLRFTIPGVVAVLLGSAAFAAEVRGFEPWRLGMTREEVLALSGTGPYTPVLSTGGLETSNARFQGKQVTASLGLCLLQDPCSGAVTCRPTMR